jgi:hypothetical protein
MPLHFRGAATPVLKWLESLPTAVLDARPSLWVVYASALLFANQVSGVEEKLGDPGGIERFPDIRAARTIENSLYLVTLILWVPHFLALYRALRGTSLAPALFGSVLGILGLGVLAAGALPHVATVPLSDLYQGSGATPADQAALILIWQATWGIFDALLFTGLAIVAAGLLALGVAMLGNPAFGKGFGWLSVILGGFGIVAAVVVLVDPDSPIAVVGIFALIIFHFVLGWKLYRLSRIA